MKRAVALLLISMVVSATSFAAPSDSGWVRVLTEPDGSPVFLDGRSVGTTPVGPLRWNAGRVSVVAQRGSRFHWDPLAVSETLNVVANETTLVRLTLPTAVLLRSNDPALLLLDREGQAVSMPVWWARERVSELSVFSKDSTAAPLTFAEISANVFAVNTSDRAVTPTVMRGTGTLGVRSESMTIASGAAMLVSGVLAVVFRDKANDAAARYLNTSDPGALSEVRTYDRLAGASMVAVQISLGAFVVFLTGS